MEQSPIKRSLLRIGLALIRMHLQGYKPIPGYTVLAKNDPYKGAFYAAVAFELPERKDKT